MTYDDRRNEPADRDDTRVVERQTYVERERPAAEPYPVPAQQPAGSQVNVNSGDGGYAAPAGPGPLSYVRRILSLLFGILAIMLGLRILLLLFVANESNNIVEFVYNVTEPFVAPFRGIFSFDQVTPGGGRLRCRRGGRPHRLAAHLPAPDGNPSPRRPGPRERRLIFS